MKRIFQPLVAVFLTAMALCLLAGAASGALGAGVPTVVASTSWVAAIVEAAGAPRVAVLAPVDLRHPPEYDFQPGDIKQALEADYLFWAGYEPFVRKLQKAAAIPDSRLIQVVTDNVPETLKEQARKVAAVLGTEAREEQWEKALDAAAADILAQAKAKGLAGRRAVVHKFLVRYAEWLGLRVVGTFGGGEELTPAKLAELLQRRPELVVDNWHNSQGASIAVEAGIPHALLINFPGKDGTRTLIDVLQYNARQLGL
ncbi:MAG: zinc ABC transporter substrate-binding protein [Bacillota bacterium]|nr:zinc ABC transporter substrate-binding protein [Bacillota bacterium]